MYSIWYKNSRIQFDMAAEQGNIYKSYLRKITLHLVDNFCWINGIGLVACNSQHSTSHATSNNAVACCCSIQHDVESRIQQFCWKLYKSHATCWCVASVEYRLKSNTATCCMRFVELSTKLLNATFNIMLYAATTSNSVVACCMRRAMLTVACNKTNSIDSTKVHLSTRCNVIYRKYDE